MPPTTFTHEQRTAHVPREPHEQALRAILRRLSFECPLTPEDVAIWGLIVRHWPVHGERDQP